MASKIAKLSGTVRSIELWHEEESFWKFLLDNYKISLEKEKKCWKNIKKTRNDK